MASWKVCAALLLCVVVALVLQAEGRGGGRARGGRRRGGNHMVSSDDDGDEGPEMTRPGMQGGRRRGGGGGRRRGGAHHVGGRPGRQGGRGQGGRRGGAGRGRGQQLQMERVMAGLSRATGEFSLSMYRQMAQENSNNFVFSPVSVYSAMSMLLLAAAGGTKRELISGLSIQTPIHPAIKAFSESLDEDDEEAILAIANRLYVQPGFQVKPRYLQRLRVFYNSSMGEFEAGNPEDAINEFVEEQTRGEIMDFLEPGTITQDTVMMLINAVYFKGMWKDQFDAAMTSMKPFQVSSTESVDVETMKREGSYKMQTSTTIGAAILELPYEGGRFSFFIILPFPDTPLSDVEARLTPDLLNETLSAEIYENRISLEMPKFSLDTDQSMKEMLRGMGIQQVFDPQRAKLRKMTRARNVYVNEVQHRAVIEVDEEGTVAAASTGVHIMRLSLPQEFKVNRPFIYLLRDKEYGMNLFMGRYTDPQGENLAL